MSSDVCELSLYSKAVNITVPPSLSLNGFTETPSSVSAQIFISKQSYRSFLYLFPSLALQQQHQPRVIFRHDGFPVDDVPSEDSGHSFLAISVR
jgi:hypothetical protein